MDEERVIEKNLQYKQMRKKLIIGWYSILVLFASINCSPGFLFASFETCGVFAYYVYLTLFLAICFGLDYVI